MSPTRRRAAVAALLVLVLVPPTLAHAGEPRRSPTSRSVHAEATPAVVTVAAPPVRPAADPLDRAEGLTFAPPVVDAVLTRGFDPPAERWSAGHRGVDLAVAPGTTVVAPGPGRVAFVGTVVDRGVVTILHDDGLRSSVEPVVSDLVAGQRVGTGDRIGEVAPSGGHCAHAGCLHWGVRDGDRYVDPLDLLPDAGPVVLLPLAGGR